MLKACLSVLRSHGNDRLHHLYDCIAPLYVVVHPFVGAVAFIRPVTAKPESGVWTIECSPRAAGHRWTTRNNSTRA